MGTTRGGLIVPRELANERAGAVSAGSERSSGALDELADAAGEATDALRDVGGARTGPGTRTLPGRTRPGDDNGGMRGKSAGLLGALGKGGLTGLGLGVGLGIAALAQESVSTALDYDRAVRGAEASLGEMAETIRDVSGEFAFTQERVAEFSKALGASVGGARARSEVSSLAMIGRATGQDLSTLTSAGPVLRMGGIDADTYLRSIIGMGRETGMMQGQDLGRFMEAFEAATGFAQMMSSYQSTINPVGLLGTQAAIGQLGDAFQGTRGLSVLGGIQQGFQTGDDFQRAFLYRALRSGERSRGSDQAGFVDLEVRREQGLGVGTNLPDVLRQLGREGYGETGSILALRELFGTTTEQAQTIFKERKRLYSGDLTGQDLEARFSKQEAEQRAKEFEPIADRIEVAFKNALDGTFGSGVRNFFDRYIDPPKRQVGEAEAWAGMLTNPAQYSGVWAGHLTARFARPDSESNAPGGSGVAQALSDFSDGAGGLIRRIGELIHITEITHGILRATNTGPWGSTAPRDYEQYD